MNILNVACLTFTTSCAWCYLGTFRGPYWQIYIIILHSCQWYLIGHLVYRCTLWMHYVLILCVVLTQMHSNLYSVRPWAWELNIKASDRVIKHVIFNNLYKKLIMQEMFSILNCTLNRNEWKCIMISFFCKFCVSHFL
jgi:hypothetical protein